jgi:tetratricopeptide (TPR) repeat protein
VARRSHDDQRRTRGTRRENLSCSASSAVSALNVVPRGGVKPRLSDPPAAGSGTRVALVALAAAFALKLAVMLQLKDHVLTQPDAGLDTTAYVALAERVLGGDPGLGPGLYFLSPLYIYFLAAVLAVWHSFTAVRLLQIVLGTGTVALVFVTADGWFGRRAAWLAAGLATLTGLFTFYESLLLQTALDPFLTAAALACLTLGLTRGQMRWFILAGLALGVQACNRPNVAFPAAVIALMLAATRRWQAAAVFSTGLAIALAPVTLRNIAVSGYWSPVTASHGGLNFYIGNNAQADGTYRSVPGITPDIKGQQEDTRRLAERAAGHALDDASVSWFFYRLGWTWIREQPVAAGKLFARKLSLMFSAKYLWLNYSYRFFAHDERTLLRMLCVGPWLLIPLGLVGLAVAAPEATRSAYLVWVSFVPAYALAVAAFYVSDRYQLLVLIPLCAGGGAALDSLVRGVAARRWTALALASAACMALFAWVNRPLALDEGVAEERTRMAERLVTLGRYDEAEHWAERAEQGNSRPGVIHFRLGQRLVAYDQAAAAIAHFQKALRLDPGQPVVEYALGETFLEAERPDEAVVPLRRALEAGVHVDQAGYDLVRALGASGDRAEAIRVLQRVRPAREDDAERWVALGELAIQLQEPPLVETFSRKAISARPDFAAAHDQLGVGLNLEHRWAEAARELEEAIRLDPRNPAPHIGLAVAEANVGRLAYARLQVEEALRLDPRSEQATRLKQALDQSRTQRDGGTTRQ